MKRFIALALCLALLCTAASATAVPGSAAIGIRAANTVTVEMRSGVTASLALAHGSVSKDQSAADLLRDAGGRGNMIAAINGGAFNADYARTSLDGYGNAPRCSAALVRDGMLINGAAGKSAPFLGFTGDGKALIDEAAVSLTLVSGSRRLSVQSVNDYYPDKADAMLLFTPEAGCDLPVPASAKAAKIVNGKVVKILGSGKMTCEADTYYFVCGKSRLGELPATGASVSFTTEFDKSAWSGVTCAVSCGPLLLRGGKDVLAEQQTSLSVTAVGGRSFAAVLAGGDLLLGTCTASPRQVVQYLLSIGARDALLLDGGASSMLWANGETLTATERKLSNAVCLYDVRFEAKRTTQSLTVNGVPRRAEIYNIGGSNYFRLRDVAALLTGTGSQFSVEHDQTRNVVVIRAGKPYKAQPGDLEPGKDSSALAVESAQSVEIDGKKVDLEAYSINGSNFFKLRDLGKALGFSVDYDKTTRTVLVRSK